MATVTGLTIIKKFDYRGDSEEEWSNKYWINGAIPADPTAWRALADALIAEEVKCYLPSTKVVRVYGYNDTADDANSVWQWDYEQDTGGVPGTLPVGTGIQMAGDQAGTVWWKTGRKTSRGKWVYLRKYFHDGKIDAANTDQVTADTAAAYAYFAQKLADGTMNNRRIRSAAQDEILQDWSRSPWVTTRTLKRRGKRPLANP